MRKLQQIGKGFDLRPRVEIFLRPAEPERAAGLGREMPLNDFAQMGIELLLRGFNGDLVNSHRRIFDLRITICDLRGSGHWPRDKSRRFPLTRAVVRFPSPQPSPSGRG